MKKINILISLSDDERTISIDFFEGNEMKNKIIDIEISDLSKGSKEKSIELFGSVIFNIFEQRSKNGMGFERTPIEGEKVLLEDAESGNASAQNALAMLYLQKSLEEKKLSFIYEAEHWLKKSAAQNFEPALKFMKKGWASLKCDYIKQINS